MQSSSGYIQNITSYIKQLKDSDDIQFDMSKREWKELEEKLK